MAPPALAFAELLRRAGFGRAKLGRNPMCHMRHRRRPILGLSTYERQVTNSLSAPPNCR
jgi:hypothetical protein